MKLSFTIEYLRAIVDAGIWAALTPCEQALLLVFMRRGDGAGRSFCGATRLAEESGMTMRSVWRSIERLETRGILATESGAGGGAPNHGATRRLVMPTPDSSVTGTPDSSVTGKSTTPDTCVRPTPDRNDVLPLTTVSPKESNRRKQVKNSAAHRSDGHDHQNLVAYFCRGWAAKYGAAFPFATSGAKNGANIKAILAGTGGNLKTATAAVDRFFADDDPWIVKNHHPLGALVNGLAKYLTPGPIEECGGKTEAEIVALIRDNPLDPDVEAACAEHEAETKRGKAEALERRAREKAAKLAKEAS